jgi:hypothetical protein
MANLQNYKQVKIWMDDMISQQFFRPQNFGYVYSICNFESPDFMQILCRYRRFAQILYGLVYQKVLELQRSLC